EADRKPGRAKTPQDVRMSLPTQAPRERLTLKLDAMGEYALQRPRQGIAGNGPRVDVQVPQNADAVAPGGEGGAAAAGKRGPKDIANLMPTAAFYDRIAGGPAPDHLDGVEEGDGTYLNTREWKYATFFNRVKQAVAQAWDP